LAVIIGSLAALISAATPITLKILDTVEKVNMIKYGFIKPAKK